QLPPKLSIRHFIDHGDDQQSGDRAGAAFRPYGGLRAANHVTAVPGSTIPIQGFTAQIIASNGSVLTSPLAGAGAPNPYCAGFALQETVPGQEANRAED